MVFINLMNDSNRLAKQTNLLALCAILVGVLGCTTAQQKEQQARQQKSLAALGLQLEALQANIATAQASLAILRVEQQSTQQNLLEALETISVELASIPQAAAALCPAPTIAVSNECDANQMIQPVVMSGDKMVVGELERVWIEPPGSFIIARVDTGANSSSMHAENLVEFERDGDDWVRFELILNGDKAFLERPVTRHVRVYQQADREGTRRPVVAMRIRLGDVQETFEFTLADRSHLDQQMMLGRNFLANTALVDVGKQFVQPQYQPQRE